MHHTAPEFCALLLQLAERDPADLSALGPLADWLEERGDTRAVEVREFRVHEVRIRSQPCGHIMAVNWGIFPRHRQPPLGWGKRADAEAEMARRVLALFPEAPRWRLEPTQHEDAAGWKITFHAPPRNTFLTLAAAKTAAVIFDTGPAALALPISGPLWPDPPA